MITAAHIKTVLDKLNKLDPDVIEKLMDIRVACNHRIVADASFATFKPNINDGGFVPTLMGTLEIVNSILIPTGQQIRVECKKRYDVKFIVVNRDPENNSQWTVPGRTRRRGRARKPGTRHTYVAGPGPQQFNGCVSPQPAGLPA